MTGETAKRRFREVVLPHLDDAYALAKWLSGNGADAEDIVQEAALKALAALEAMTPLKARAVVARNRPQHGADLDGAAAARRR